MDASTLATAAANGLDRTSVTTIPSVTPTPSGNKGLRWAPSPNPSDSTDSSPRTAGGPDSGLLTLSKTQMDGGGGVSELEQESEVRRWAADRQQALSRTVRGVMLYGDALRVLARLEGVAEEEVEEVVASKFEYVVTCQIYDKLKHAELADKVKELADRGKAEAVDELRYQFPESLKIAYVEQNGNEYHSCLLGVDPLTREGSVLYKVKLPGNPIIGEGKPENQNHAVIFARGECLQTLDMNQDNYMGEAFKMRNLLEGFVGEVRIIGFREHIFSEQGGAVANFAASNEFVFGTIVPKTNSLAAAKLATAPPLSEKMCSRKPTMRTRSWKHSSRLRILYASPM